jgi:hypothetical protein
MEIAGFVTAVSPGDGFARRTKHVMEQPGS